MAFATFWEKYPRKVGKPKALVAYASGLARGATAEGILAGLLRHLGCQQWQDLTKVPHPTTWLNRDGWNDQVVTGPTANGEHAQWWDTKRGVLDKGLELQIPAPADESTAKWFEFMAAVWVAAGDGPWWDKNSVAHPIALRLRQSNADVLTAVAAGLNRKERHAA